MMTQENTRQLKTALGLENLKGLGNTLKQSKELMEKAEEFQKMFGELAKENSPIAKAIADRLGAETLQSLKEGDVTALGELKTKIEEENQKLKEGYTAVVEENRQLKEVLQAKTTREIIGEELDRRLPKGGNPGGDDNLTTAINNLVAERLNALVGGGQQGNLTAEDIRKIIGEEVAKGTQGNNSPDQVTDNIVKMLTVSDTVKQKLGISEGGMSRFLPPQGGDSGLRTDLVKVLLEDERERIRITQNHGVEVQRNRHIGTIAETVKENLGTGIAAITAAAQEIKAGTGAKAATAAPQEQLHTFTCGHCQKEFAIRPEDWPKLVSGQLPGVPCPHCQNEYTREQLMA